MIEAHKQVPFLLTFGQLSLALTGRVQKLKKNKADKKKPHAEVNVPGCPLILVGTWDGQQVAQTWTVKELAAEPAFFDWCVTRLRAAKADRLLIEMLVHTVGDAVDQQERPPQPPTPNPQHAANLGRPWVPAVRGKVPTLPRTPPQPYRPRTE